MERAVAVMNKLSSYSVSRLFSGPIDPEMEGPQKSREAVRVPMDLRTVRKKLDNNEYESISEWKADVELIWSNCLAMYDRKSLMRIITLEMQDIFAKQTEHITDNPDMDWMDQLRALNQELKSLSAPKKSSKPPKPKASPKIKLPKRVQSEPATEQQLVKDDSEAAINPTAILLRKPSLQVPAQSK